MTSPKKPELLAPAGEAASAYAALYYGADAVYLGLGKFSARAEAVNFSPGELGELVGFARSLCPARRVYLTLNTLVKENELAEAAETLLVAAEQGVDAIIVQDLGIMRTAKRYVPAVKLHASTQMAVHSLEGAKAARDLGFDRVTLARELTLREVERIAGESGLEVETFIHGALCYSYSGLCLYSSMASGRSGNRGRCAYPCREAARVDGGEGRVHPFSLKDIALGPRVLDLARAGVRSLKIEGRKKSPLYVAATVDYYRRILDGTLDPMDREAAEARLKTIFARPWTELFIDGVFNPEVGDLEVVGHRGAPLGTVEETGRGAAGDEVRFTAALPVELHDGIQTDVDGEERPFGFAVNELFSLAEKGRKRTFAAPAGARIAVTLPPDAPRLRVGQRLYLASSQEVKRSYPFPIPKQGLYSPRQTVDIQVRVSSLPDGEGGGTGGLVEASASARLPEPWSSLGRREGGGEMVEAACSGTFAAYPARDREGAAEAMRKAFSRLGDSEFSPGGFECENPDGLYVKPGDLNALRRLAVSRLREGTAAAKAGILARIDAELAVQAKPAASGRRLDGTWSLCCDDLRCLSSFTDADFADCVEVAVGVGEGGTEKPADSLARLAGRIGAEKIRLALPLVMRREAEIAKTAAFFLKAGWRRWLVRSLAGWRMLRDLSSERLDLAADWPLYALNYMSVESLREMGFNVVTLSPEDDKNNISLLAASAGGGTDLQVVVYADLPLFISAACVHAQLSRCPGGPDLSSPARCGKGALSLNAISGKELRVIPASCGSVVLGDRPYSLAGHVDELLNVGLGNFRIDYCWRKYSPDEALSVWKNTRSGKAGMINSGNFLRRLI